MITVLSIFVIVLIAANNKAWFSMGLFPLTLCYFNSFFIAATISIVSCIIFEVIKSHKTNIISN